MSGGDTRQEEGIYIYGSYANISISSTWHGLSRSTGSIANTLSQATKLALTLLFYIREKMEHSRANRGENTA
jgi:hypothetical protein